MELAFRGLDSVSGPTSARFTDAAGVLPLEIGGTPVVLTQFPCNDATCKPFLEHPPGPGQRWFYFKSQTLPGLAGNTQTDYGIEFTFASAAPNALASGSSEACVALVNVPVATFVSDTKDDLYGSVVHDLYVEGLFRPNEVVPTMPLPGILLLGGAMVVAFEIARRRRKRLSFPKARIARE